ELFHEAELMQAIEKIQSNEYAGALSLIGDAKKWPLNLGVGKPYQENIDERLEDWMDYLCFARTGQTKDANRSLQKIIQFSPKVENTVSNFLPANHLVTAWAIEKLNGKLEAVKWLNGQIKQYPDNKIIQWCKQVFENQHPVNADTSDAEVRLLNRLIQLK
ncbi:MAG: hypothetical protein ACXVAU_11235, partial [Mucilaginibacter sp.]